MPPLDVTTHVVTPIWLADFTRPALVLPHLRERDTPGVIGELSQALQREGTVPDVLSFYQCALNQELLSNSALECGIAFPHGRLPGVRQLQFALGRRPEPMVWGSKRSWPVEFIFLIAVPATDAATYLHLLATIARLGQQPAILHSLRQAHSATEIFAVLKQATVRH